MTVVNGLCIGSYCSTIRFIRAFGIRKLLFSHQKLLTFN